MGQSDSCSNSLMIVDIPAAQGSYLVIGRLVNDIQFITGPFLGQELLRGHYLYSGSAFGPGGLRSRIFRHLNLETKKFWHFDHLKNNLRFKEIIFSTDVIGRECNFY